MIESNTTPPQNIDAEKSVLSAVYMDNGALDIVIDMLKPEDFYLESHRIIFQGMIDLYCAGKPVDLITLAEHLARCSAYSEIVLCAISDLAGNISTAANVEYWASIVKDKAMLRNVMIVCSEIEHEISRGDSDTSEVLDRFQGKVMALTDSVKDSGVVKIQQSSIESYNHIEAVHEGKKSQTGIFTGISPLDYLTGGLQRGGYTIIAARPSMGKSALALNIAINMALDKEPVIYFSTEMTRDVLTKRLMAAVTGCTFERLMRYQGQFSSEELRQVTDAVTKLQSATMTLVDRRDLNELTIRNVARRQKKEYGSLSAIFVDHINHLSYSQRHKGMSENDETTKISRALSSIAQELNCNIVVVSQLNRDCEKRPDKRPTLADLRNSGSLEQDADIIGFVYREGYYDKEKNPGLTEFNVAKNRNGATRKLNLWFDLANQKITELK